jgi:hypothetical protein
VAWRRVHDQFGPEYQDLLRTKGQAAADSFIDSLLTLETAANLGLRDEMTIFGITARLEELASWELCTCGQRLWPELASEPNEEESTLFVDNNALRRTWVGRLDCQNGHSAEKLQSSVRSSTNALAKAPVGGEDIQRCTATNLPRTPETI